MTEIISTSVRPHNSALSTERSPLLPLPELPITVRLATMDDIPFIDELQKKNNKSLGFMNRPTLEGKIKREEILIAEEVASGQLPVASEEKKSTGGVPTVAPDPSGLATNHWPLATRVGYLIGNDRYFKRDEVGIVYQLCVVPGRRRGLVGATLLKSLFERASYGTKLYCCWCAQDLEANHFWEAMGFVPVAFRTGSRNKNKRVDGKKSERIHIFWQRRIRSGDKITEWWYPHQTGGGAIDEDRIVLPIDPRLHWSEVKAVILPGAEIRDQQIEIGDQKALTSDVCPSASTPKTPKPKRPKVAAPVVPVKSSVARLSVPQFGSKAKAQKPSKEKIQREKPVKQKNDPAKVKAARELRDRYMEAINLQQGALESHGKYDVSRMVEAVPVQLHQKLLAA